LRGRAGHAKKRPRQSLGEIAAKRIAVVTGANRGIGFEVARQLGRLGFRVVLTARRLEEGNRAAQRLAADGLDVIPHRLDVTDPGQATDLAHFLGKEFGRLDALVNNAAVYLDEGCNLLEVPVETFEATLRVNLYGPLLVTSALIPLMMSHNYGRVVNVSSEAGSLAGMGSGALAPSYAISKSALNALTRILAAEVRGYDIKVNAVCPGWVRTDMGGRSAPRSPEKGAETVTWLATLPSEGPSGGFFRDRKQLPW
jgi:NAD(P)-dependent dehydrogenase (short-subunit alcohol dehydrogenase family)